LSNLKEIVAKKAKIGLRRTGIHFVAAGATVVCVFFVKGSEERR
jgi:hypothetical protein